MKRIVLTALALQFFAIQLSAQLRPVPPLDWRLFDFPSPFLAEAGFGLLREQHASLAGTKGTLYELGNFNIGWRTGRVVLELSGTAHRWFEDEEVVRPPVLGADPPPPSGELRHDAGDVRASTMIRVLGETWPVALVLRFGTRLPTTSEEMGLDRDRTDFFATVGTRYRRGRFAVSGESGVGINGTRIDRHDQSDVWTYSFGVEYGAGPVTSTAVLLGHNDGHEWVARGNEDLSELRLGVRAGDRFWVQATAVKGLAEFSPGHGLLLTAGLRR
ncbi:MAG: hypothetical protein ACREMQ_13825 [Longimicrobiales bacterium]